MACFTPINQKRLTNVAVVRIQKSGKRFEIACYPNKVKPWREGIEKDLREVLQADRVFANVSKGEFAREKDLMAAFNTKSQIDICKQILRNGDLRSSDIERQLQQNNLSKEISKLISKQCINTDTGKPFPPEMIEQTINQLKVPITGKPAKVQAVSLIKVLIENGIPITRNSMNLRINLMTTAVSDFFELVKNLDVVVMSESEERSQSILNIKVDPSAYRPIEDYLETLNDPYDLCILSDDAFTKRVFG